MSEDADKDLPPAETLVTVYIKMRDARSKLKADYEAKDDVIKEQMDIIESSLLKICNAAGATSIRTAAGTAVRSVSTRYTTADWESMYEFIKENNVPELLEKRIAQGNMTTFLSAHPDKLPKGLNVDSRYTITVRRGK